MNYFFAFIFCSSTLCAQETLQRENEIRTVLNAQVAAWNAGSIEHFMEGYAQSDSLRFASDGTVTYGWKPMLERYKKSYTTKEQMGMLQFSKISITVVADDAALAFGEWHLQRKHDSPHGLFTLLFRKLNGVWRIVHDHTSSAKEK